MVRKLRIEYAGVTHHVINNKLRSRKRKPRNRTLQHMESENGRQRILESARGLLLSRGYSGFSYADISEEVGMRKASIHYHFPSKEDLGAAFVEQYHAETLAMMRAADALSPRERIEAYLRSVEQILKFSDRICASGILEAEYNVLPESVQRRVKKMVADVQKWLAHALAEARAAGAAEFEGKPEDQAALLMASTQGALQMARLNRKHFAAITRQIRRSLGWNA